MNFETKNFPLKDGDPAIVIAEIGVNHNGDPAVARRLVDEAARNGADVVKFQAFRSEKEISRFAAKTQYQKETTSEAGNQLEMCKALELSGPVLRELKGYCAARAIPFLCAAFDFDSIDLLADDLKVATIKIPSGEVTNLPMLEYVASKRVAVILSTGASTLDEVGKAVAALRRGGCDELMLFHCVSSYPAPAAQANLRAMRSLKAAFGVPVGYSDHTLGIDVALAAATLGAVAIEKHLTLDRNMEGPDHRASIEPQELAALARGVAHVHGALGDGIKAPAPCELENLPLIRKSLVAARALPRGTQLERAMIEIKRPQGGIEPGELGNVVGRRLRADVEEDAPLRWQDLE